MLLWHDLMRPLPLPCDLYSVLINSWLVLRLLLTVTKGNKLFQGRFNGLPTAICNKEQNNNSLLLICTCDVILA